MREKCEELIHLKAANVVPRGQRAVATKPKPAPLGDGESRGAVARGLVPRARSRNPTPAKARNPSRYAQSNLSNAPALEKNLLLSPRRAFDVDELRRMPENR